jgi:hypothetical protein
MKTNLMRFLALLLIGMVTFTACEDDSDEIKKTDSGTDGVSVELADGYYVVPTDMALTDVSTTEMMTVARNERYNSEYNDGTKAEDDRASLLEVYYPIESDKGFLIMKVSNKKASFLSPESDFAKVDAADLDGEEPTLGLWKGKYGTDSAAFSVDTNALYHIFMDYEIKKAGYAVAEWRIIGGATPAGWSDNEMVSSDFSKTEMTWSIDEIIMLESAYKWRYSAGWKAYLDADFDLGDGKTGLVLNTNLGGTYPDLVPGGADIVNDKYGVYKAEVKWTKANGVVATLTWVKEGEVLPEYPEELYMIGSAIGGWDWEANALQLTPVNSHSELFWTIAYMHADSSFKFAPQKEWKGDFGKTGDATDGVYAKGSDNVPVPAVTGYYIVVVDLKNETIELNTPKVMFMGAATATPWTGEEMAFDYSVEDAVATHTLTNATGADGVRMYASAATLACDWWQAEFIVLDGKIEYRGTGGDQARVVKDAGTYTFTLNFKAGTGSIE